MIYLLSIFTHIYAQISTPLTAYRPRAMSLGKSSYELRLPGSIFMSTGVLDDSGNSTALTDTFYSINGGLTADYYLGNSLMLGFGTNLRFNMVPTDEQFKYVGNLQGVWGGMQYFFNPIGSLHYSIFLKSRFNMNQNPKHLNSEMPMDLGRDGIDLSIGADISNRFAGNHVITAGFGIEILPNDLSPVLNLNLESAWLYSRWALYFGVESKMALYDSEITDVQLDYLGSNYYALKNQMHVAPFIGLNFVFSSIRLDLKYNYFAFGKNTDTGHLFELAFTKQRMQRPSYYSRKISSFKNYAIEANITEVSRNQRFIKIAKGLSQGIVARNKVDVYSGEKLVAEGTVYKLNSRMSIIRLSRKFVRDRISTKMTVRMN